MTTTETPVGHLLRDWRKRRGMSQLELASRAEVSTRHLSFLETGRSRPTSTMIVNLCERLDVPLRERNAMLLAGGFAPAYSEHRLDATPMAAVSEAITQILRAHHPFPAVVIDRHWEMVDANESIGILISDVDPRLLEPPVNVLRLSLHPDGLAPRILNLGEWRAHLLHRLEQEIAGSGDQDLTELLDELRGYPGGTGEQHDAHSIIVPMQFRAAFGDLSLLSVTTVFGTPRDVTVAELAIESFYPADAETAALLRS